jgi:hypothetical protein
MALTIQSSEDFTPLGKRTARCVQTGRGGSQLRWYVGGRIFNKLSVTQSNIALTRDWGNSVSTMPQDWDAFA